MFSFSHIPIELCAQNRQLLSASLCTLNIAFLFLKFVTSLVNSGVRPFGVSLLVAGYDDKGPQLYQVSSP